jgi:RimJ/RimL family protein N-acetyltransferase
MSPWPGAVHFPGGVTVETERLRLRLMEERDLDAIAAIFADAETMQYIGEGKVFNRNETWRSISSVLGHWLLKGYGMWTVETRDGGEVVGRVGFIDPAGWPGFELGWIIAKPHWGHGYATEAARAAYDYAIHTLKRERVISLIRPGNDRSVRVAEKLGFTRDGMVELLGMPAMVYANRRTA